MGIKFHLRTPADIAVFVANRQVAASYFIILSGFVMSAILYNIIKIFAFFGKVLIMNTLVIKDNPTFIRPFL